MSEPRAGSTDELRAVSATETARRVRGGELTAVAAVTAALERIEAAEPMLNAFSRIRRAEALAEAAVVDGRVAAGDDLPLAGVPVAAKDDSDVAGEVVTMASWAMNTVSTGDSELIRRVRAAGGVIVGLTRTPELCLMPYCESDRGGVTRNPWDTERTPGGSSGGSVAAVSAGLVPLALGGDGGGSIRGPAAWTGLPGLFPTVGNVPTAPEPAIWGGLGVPGGFGRSIEDTALLYDVIGTPDWNLRQVIQQDAPPLSIALSYDRASDKPVPTGGPIDASWRQATERTAATLTGLGHAVQPVSVPFGNAAVKFTLRYLAQLGIEAAKTDDPSKLETNTRLLAAIGRPAKRALGWASNNAPERASVEGALRGHAILLTPAMPVPPPRVGENAGQNGVRVSLRAARRVSFLSVWNHLGWPAITVPAGLDPQGLPLGVLLVGRPGSEPLLLQVAAGLEKAAPWPQLAPFRA